MSGSLTDVSGIRVGHWTDLDAATGCTVVLAPSGGAMAAADVRGPAAGTLGTEALQPGRLIDRVDAVLLTGGSAFGLAAAAGVIRHLEEHGIGYPLGTLRIPIVIGAVIFDLGVGDPHTRPDAESGYAAAGAATDAGVREGTVGAGTGASVGKLIGEPGGVKGGLGTASTTLGDGTVVAGLAVANAVGDVVDPATGRIVAGTRAPDGSGWLDSAALLRADHRQTIFGLGNTTLAVVATDATLTKNDAAAVAMMAHDGIARATRPSHTMFDGDTVVVLSTGGRPASDVTAIGSAGADLVAVSIVRAVLEATPLAGLPATRDL
jgi:L-aminopeptidase/D-esterase-like protein